MFLFAPLSSSPCFSDSIVGHLHVIHYFRINLFQHVASIGHSPDIYSDVVVSSGCSEIFAHLHRLLSGQSALVWALKMWQFLQKMSTPSSTSCSLDICSGVDISMIWREISALEFGAPPSSPSLTLVHRVASQTFFQFSFLTASEWYFAYSDDKSSSRQHQLGWWALVLLCYSQQSNYLGSGSFWLYTDHPCSHQYLTLAHTLCMDSYTEFLLNTVSEVYRICRWWNVCISFS